MKRAPRQTKTERWRQVDGWPGYEVSDLGRVRSWHAWRGQPVPRLLNPSRASYGTRYFEVSMYREGLHQVKRLHRLVAAAFLGPMPEGMTRWFATLMMIRPTIGRRTSRRPLRAAS